MMKKYFSILSLVLMAMCCNVVFSSCGDDDDDEVVVEKQYFDKRIIGTWESFVDHGLCRDVLIFDADGNYYQMDQDTQRRESVMYYDDNLTYYQTKGYYNAINGTLSGVETHEWDHKWNEKEWRKSSMEGPFSVSYEIVDENTLNISKINGETGKEETDTYTRVK
jgi:hypothetical protein